MPIYEYRCRSCGHDVEALQKFSDPALTTCPSCHAEALVKRVSAAGFQLKGTGWYATDFKGNGKSTPAKEAKQTKDSGGDAAAGENSKPAETKSGESATEAKSEAKDKSTSTGSAATPST